MKKFKITLIMLLSLNCGLLKNTSFSKNLFLALGAAVGWSADSSNYPQPVDITPPPSISYPENSLYSGATDAFAVETTETIPTPAVLDGVSVPIGKVYEVGLHWAASQEIKKEEVISLQLPEPVELVYQYDRKTLSEAGFIEEFKVHYFDSLENKWIELTGVEVDFEKQSVKVKTTHFTPFVLSSIPSNSTDNTISAPACLDTNSPISGTPGSKWVLVDANYNYYQDRNYVIKPNNDFYSLGFNQAYGISTCNGGVPSPGSNFCGSFDDHKYNQSENYISFLAETDISVFIMYDSRGSSDAIWFNRDGWTLLDKKIESSDAVGHYKIYEKKFLKGEAVSLHGNRLGLPTNTQVSTNYWVVVKPTNLSDSSSCLVQSINYENKLSDIRYIEGGNKITFLWDDLANSSVSNVIVRRKINVPSISLADGSPVNATDIETRGFIDEGLESNTKYFYSFFTYNTSGVLSPSKTISVTTQPDSDGDGLSDIYEMSDLHTYKNDLKTNINNSDTDQDGTSDLWEIINGTDPTINDVVKPVVQDFQLLSKNQTSYPMAKVNLNASDNIAVVGYFVSNIDKKPRSSQVGWTTNVSQYLPLKSGLNKIYIWVKDEAGNISESVSPLQVTLDPVSIPKITVKIDHTNKTLMIYAFDINQNNFVLKKSHNLLTNEGYGDLHPSGKFLTLTEYSNDGMTKFTSVRVDSETGDLTKVNSFSLEFPGVFSYSPDGKYFVVVSYDRPSLYYDRVRAYRLNELTGELTLASTSPLLSQKQFESLMFHPSGRYAYPNKFDNGLIQIVDLANNGELNPSAGNLAYEVYRFEFHPEGKFGYYRNGSTGKFGTFLIDQVNGGISGGKEIIVPNYDVVYCLVNQKGNQLYIIGRSKINPNQYSLLRANIINNTGDIDVVDSVVLSDSYNSMEMDPSANILFLHNGMGQKIAIYSAGDFTENLQYIGENTEFSFLRRLSSDSKTNLTPKITFSLKNPIAFYQGSDVGLKYPYGENAILNRYSRIWAPFIYDYRWNPDFIGLESYVNDPMAETCQKTNLDDSLSIVGVNPVPPVSKSGTPFLRRFLLHSYDLLYGTKEFNVNYSYLDQKGNCENHFPIINKSLLIKVKNVTTASLRYVPESTRSVNTDEHIYGYYNHARVYHQSKYATLTCKYTFKRCNLGVWAKVIFPFNCVIMEETRSANFLGEESINTGNDCTRNIANPSHPLMFTAIERIEKVKIEKYYRVYKLTSQ